MISLIVPTLGEREKELRRLLNSLMEQTGVELEVIIVSQKNHKKVEEVIFEYDLKIKHIPIDKLGLSIARNIGIRECQGNIITFSDDDCWYPNNVLKQVESDFSNEDSIDIICYQIFDPEKKVYLRNYKSNAYYLNKINLLNRLSIEIFINTDKVSLNDIKFDEEFGLGAKYPSGEENIILNDLIKKKYKGKSIPDVIVYHSKKQQNTQIPPSLFISKGALFRRIFNLPIGIILYIAFYIKKRNILQEKSIFILLRGILTFLKLKK